jgi:hypothetical protein
VSARLQLFKSEFILKQKPQANIICSYIRKTISQVYKPTIGADFHSKKLEIMEADELKTVTLQV